MFLLCCSKFTRTLDKSNRSSLSHLVQNHRGFEPKSETVNGYMCVIWMRKSLNSVVSVCARKKRNKNSLICTHIHQRLIVLKVWIENHFTRVEPNENDWPNHFRLKIDVVDMKWIQYNCECVRSNREFVGVRVCVCDCDACCFIGVCMCKTEQSFLSVKATD